MVHFIDPLIIVIILSRKLPRKKRQLVIYEVYSYLNLFLGKTMENNQNSQNNQIKDGDNEEQRKYGNCSFFGDGKYNQHTRREMASMEADCRISKFFHWLHPSHKMGQ